MSKQLLGGLGLTGDYQEGENGWTESMNENLQILNELELNKAAFVGIKNTNTDDVNYSGGGATGSNAVAIGAKAEATSFNTVAIGREVLAANDQTTAIGSNVIADGAHSVVIGTNLNSKNAGIVLGSASNNAGYAAVSLGVSNTIGDASDAIAIGNNNTVNESASNTVAIGSSVDVKGPISIGIGHRSRTDGNNAIAIGASAEALEVQSTAIGRNAKSENQNSIAIGTNAKALLADSVSIGSDSETTQTLDEDDQIATPDPFFVKHDGVRYTTNNVVSVGNEYSKRRIQNVAPGAEENDVVTVEQLKSTAINYVSIKLDGPPSDNVNNDGAVEQKTIAIGPNTASTAYKAVAIGNDIINGGYYSLAAGDNITNSGSNAVVLGSNITSKGDFNVNIGHGVELPIGYGGIHLQAKSYINSYSPEELKNVSLAHGALIGNSNHLLSPVMFNSLIGHDNRVGGTWFNLFGSKNIDNNDYEGFGSNNFYSTILGFDNKFKDSRINLLGSSNKIIETGQSSGYTNVFGNSNEWGGYYNSVVGFSNKLKGTDLKQTNYNTVSGTNNQIGNQCYSNNIVGSSNELTGISSTMSNVVGNYNTSLTGKNNLSSVVGNYNDFSTEQNQIFGNHNKVGTRIPPNGGGYGTIVIGNSNDVDALQSIVIGNNISADFDFGIYLGAGAKANFKLRKPCYQYSAKSPIEMSFLTQRTAYKPNPIGKHQDISKTRDHYAGNDFLALPEHTLIRNVADGADDNDAVNVKQLYTLATVSVNDIDLIRKANRYCARLNEGVRDETLENSVTWIVTTSTNPTPVTLTTPEEKDTFIAENFDTVYDQANHVLLSLKVPGIIKIDFTQVIDGIETRNVNPLATLIGGWDVVRNKSQIPEVNIFGNQFEVEWEPNTAYNFITNGTIFLKGS